MNENSTIKKPMSVAREEFISALIELINGSGLPMFVVEPILKDMYNDVRNLSKKQTEEEKKEYLKAIKEQDK